MEIAMFGLYRVLGLGLGGGTIGVMEKQMETTRDVMSVLVNPAGSSGFSI